jgi:alcohol dehydrogenase (NADP+)
MSTGVTLAPDGVDPASVPLRRLASGATIPAIGLGTFGSDRFCGLDIASAVAGAASVGYRHFDCAAVYGNEHLIGHALQAVMGAGVARDELWITSKLWNDKHAEADVIPACMRTLRDLQLDYLDLYLTHWPFRNTHQEGASGDARRADATPYRHEAFMETWRQMERLVELGLVRHIGTSNMTIPKLTLLLRDASIRPVINEMELHPHFQQPELFNYLADNGITPVGFAPIGSPNRPDRDRAPEDPVDTQDPVIVRIGDAHKLHPAVVCLKWAVQRGQIPIPFSIRREQYLTNLREVVTDPLTDDEMREIGALDRNARLIKGQVFLWRDNQPWEDLWDVNGEIAQ